MGLTQNIFQLLLGFFASLLLLPPPPLHCCSVQAIFSSDILIQPQNPDSHYSLHVSDLLISSCPFHQPVLPEMPFTANIVSPLSVHLSGGGGGFQTHQTCGFFLRHIPLTPSRAARNPYQRSHRREKLSPFWFSQA